MTYDEYEKYMDEWQSKEKAAGREIFEIIKKYNLSAGETKTLLKDLKRVGGCQEFCVFRLTNRI